MNNYNYTEAALLGFNKTMNDVSAVINSVDDLLIPCATRIYNISQHVSSIVTEVSTRSFCTLYTIHTVKISSVPFATEMQQL